MAVNTNTLKTVLGDAYDPRADYLVTGRKDRLRMKEKGYKEVGQFHREEDLWIFDRRPPQKAKGRFKR